MPGHARRERTGSSQCRDQTSNPSEDPTSCRGKINNIAGSKNRASTCRKLYLIKTNLWFWMPTANHKNNLHGLTEDLTWILHSATSLSLVWISPTRTSPPEETKPSSADISLLFLSCLCLPQQVTPCFLPPVPSGRYPPSSPAASEQPTWEALRKTAKNNNPRKPSTPRGVGGLHTHIFKLIIN